MCTSWFEKLKIQKQLKTESEYQMLNFEEQDKLFKELMN